ncbi:MAG: PE_PGRS family protein [Anaerolineae bacterium]|nr:MAG: PE_PGRS family protein [Anaerolineae bacterium]
MITILDNGLRIEDGIFRYAWFRLATPEGEKYRCVALAELASVPYDLREDPDVLGKQWAMLRGIYNAAIDFVYSALGIYTPEPIGIVQLYGAAGEGETLENAALKALNGIAAVEAAIANFPQAQIKAPNLRWIEWYLDFVARAKNLLVLLGHPDPRASKRGLGKDANLPDYAEDDLAAEQNEILFRGLAKLREDFLFQVTAHHIPRRQLASGLVRVAEVASNIASRRRGTVSIGFNFSIPILAALGQSTGGSKLGSQSSATSHTDSVNQSHSTAHTDSHSHGVSESWTEGGAKSHTRSISSTTSESDSTNWGQSESSAHSVSHAETNSTSVSKTSGTGSSWSVGGGSSWSQGGSEMASGGVGHTDSASAGHTASVGSGTTFGVNASTSHSTNQGINAGVNFGTKGSLGVPGVGSIGADVGGNAGWSMGQTNGHSQGSSMGVSHNVGSADSVSRGSADSSHSGWAKGSSWSQGGSSSWSSGGSSFESTTKTSGHAVTDGVTDTVGKSKSWGGGHTKGQAFSQGEAWTETESWAHSTGRSEAWGTADTVGEQTGRAHTDGVALGEASARGISQGLSMGLSTGIVPGISLGRSWQTEDDVADRLTEILRQFEGLLNQASAEGGFMTDALLLTASERGAAAVETLAPQAFHGVNVPTPVLTVKPFSVQDEQVLRASALAVLPSPTLGDGDPFDGLLWTRYATLLSAGQLAAYTAPGLVEEGTAVVTIAPTPKGLTFYPIMSGDVVLGHQFSPLTRDLTPVQVRLDQERLFHTMFAADTGFGKTVSAMRLAYETTIHWHLRTVVLDFGAGWRALLNAPGLEGHVDIRQLWPSAARPLRWNPLQIGRNINPETQWRAFADIFGSVARLGVKRQKQELLDALRKIYIAAGVLVDDPEVRRDPQWGKVWNNEEADLVQAKLNTPLGDLTLEQKQRLAVQRSSRVGLNDLYQTIQDKLSQVPSRDTMLTGVLEGILYRLNALVQGAASIQFAPGSDTVPMEDLAKPWGIAIIEGGMFLDDFGKAFLLGWIGWHLYTDMVARRVHEVNTDEPLLQIFFEEANKIFGGVDAGSEDDTGGVSLSQRFGDMFRDARKYKARLHVITQAPSLIPQDIISSCNNLVVGFLKNPKDKDIVLSGIARSEKGFVDEPWRRFLADLQIGMFIGRFPYSTQREMQQPFLFRPLPVGAPEPTDEEIAARIGRIVL